MSKSPTNASPISGAEQHAAKGQGPDGMNADDLGYVVVCRHCFHSINSLRKARTESAALNKWFCCHCGVERESVKLQPSIPPSNVGGYSK